MSSRRLQIYLKHRLWFEAAFATSATAIVTTTTATTRVMDALRDGAAVGSEPWVDEYTSGAMILLLIPLVVWSHSKWPLTWLNWTRIWWIHVVGFCLFTTLHVSGMEWLRALLGHGESFGNVWFELLYEARKDLLTYLVVVIITYGYVFILNRLQGEASFPQQQPSERRETFLVKMLGREMLVPVDEIDWIQSARNYALLMVGERSYPVRQTMASLEAELEAQGFLRVHRSAIVNLNAVVAQHGGQSDRTLELRSGEIIGVSSARLADLPSKPA